jgi:hypothetical protein
MMNWDVLMTENENADHALHFELSRILLKWKESDKSNSFKALAKKVNVSYAYLRQLVSGDVREPGLELVTDLLIEVMPLPDVCNFLNRHFKKFSGYMDKIIAHKATVAKIPGRLGAKHVELYAHLHWKKQISMVDVASLIGPSYISVVSDLAEMDLIEIELDHVRVNGEHTFVFSQDFYYHLTMLALANIDIRQRANQMESRAAGLNDRGLSMLYDLEFETRKKCVDIILDPKNQGNHQVIYSLLMTII